MLQLEIQLRSPGTGVQGGNKAFWGMHLTLRSSQVWWCIPAHTPTTAAAAAGSWQDHKLQASACCTVTPCLETQDNKRPNASESLRKFMAQWRNSLAGNKSNKDSICFTLKNWIRQQRICCFSKSPTRIVWAINTRGRKDKIAKERDADADNLNRKLFLPHSL